MESVPRNEVSRVIFLSPARSSNRFQERSIDGFTVLVPPKAARHLKVGGPWKLTYDGSEIEVHPQWFFNSPEGQVQMGLRQVRDLTKFKPVYAPIWSRLLPSKRFETSASSTVA